MEKTKNALSSLLQQLELIHIKAGDQKADCLSQVKALDSKIDIFIKEAVSDGLAEVEYKDHGIFPSADARIAEFENDVRLSHEQPESLLPMAADVICRQIQTWFRDNLLLFVKTTQLSRTLLVEVSGLLSGPHASDSDSPVTARAEYEEKVERLRQKGWVYGKDHNHLELLNCPENLEKIKQVIEWIGGKMPCILLHNTRVREFSFRIPCDDCKEVFHALAAEEKLAEQSKGELAETVTDDEAEVIQRNLKDIRFALAGINYMDDKSVVLSLLRSYTASVEEALGFTDLICAKVIQARHADEARKNRELRKQQDNTARAALEALDLRAAYTKIEEALQKVFCHLGLRVDNLFFSGYTVTRFCAMPRTYYHEYELRQELELIKDVDDRTVYLLDTPENIINLTSIISEVMPGVSLESLEAATRGHGQIIKKLNFRICPADIALLLDKTKDMEPVDEF